MRARLNSIGIAVGVLVAATIALVTRQQAFRHHAATQQYEDIYYLPSPRTLSVASMGYREALADLLWMRTLVYFGDEIVHRGDKSNLLHYADAILGLDPYFRRIYRWVGTVALYREDLPSKQDMLDAVRYLEQGFRLFPDDGELAWTLGATYAYELVQFEKDPEARDALRVKGHEYIRIAVLKGGAPGWMAGTTARFFAKAGRKEEALRHLREVYSMLDNDKDRGQVEFQIMKLEGEAYVERLRAHERAFKARQARSYPYLDPALFTLVGDRLEDVDIEQIRAHFDPVGPEVQIDDTL